MKKLLFFVIIPICLFARDDFEGIEKPYLNGKFAGRNSAYYCHFNIPFYMSYLGGENKSKAYFFSGFASQIGQFQYTHKINDTAKWGWGWGLPLLTLYAEKEWSIFEGKNINTSLLIGGPPVSISTKIYLPIDETGYYFYGFSTNYIFHAGSFHYDQFFLFSPFYPRSHLFSFNYESIYDMDSFNFIFSLGLNYLVMSYVITGNNDFPEAEWVNRQSSGTQWEKRPAWNASVGINF